MSDTPYKSPGYASDGVDVDISGDVRGMQIVTGALIAGVVVFTGVALVTNGFQIEASVSSPI